MSEVLKFLRESRDIEGGNLPRLVHKFHAMLQPTEATLSSVAMLLQICKLYITKKSDLTSEDMRGLLIETCDATDDEALTALIYACLGGDLGIVKLLLEMGADVNKGDRYGLTPLAYAYVQRNKPIIHTLLAHGAHQADLDKSHVFIDAVVTNDIDMAALFLETSGGNNNLQGQSGYRILQKACEYENIDLRMLSLLTSYGASANATEEYAKDMYTPLITACMENNHEVVEFLISRCNANVNFQLSEKLARITALHVACVYYNTAIAKTLIINGANLNLQDSFGRTAMFCLFWEPDPHPEDCWELFHLLLEHGADIDLEPESGIARLEDFLQNLSLDEIGPPSSRGNSAATYQRIEYLCICRREGVTLKSALEFLKKDVPISQVRANSFHNRELMRSSGNSRKTLN